MAENRDVDELELQLKRAELPKRAEGDLICHEQELRAKSGDAGPSHQSRNEEPPLWPKHKIFLSHSGVQKGFTDRLCEALERVNHFPFFDTRPDSLRKGKPFYPPLMTAAQGCRVAVLVLSEEFFTASKWPMMEVNEFVKTQKSDKPVCILPLYFQISREELQKPDSQERWIKAWKVMASKDKRIKVDEWEYALKKITGNTGMAYSKNTEVEGTFIRKVVEEVCRLLPPDVKWDVSNVMSMKELSEPILRKLKDAKRRGEYNVQVVGLYGMGGAGKTTISRAICNEMFGDFVGKVCYIEFGKMEVEELLRIVLQELTEADPAILRDKHHDQLLYLLRERIHRQKVFLVLDNVLGGHELDAQMFLDVRYCDGCMVLVTSRSLDVLVALGLQSDDCLEMPNVEEEGAIDMFLYYANRCRESVKDEEWKVIRGCVQECHFLKDIDLGFGREGNHHYLPLALKVLGTQLRSIGKDVFVLKKKLGELRKGKGEKFNMLKEKTHPISSVLRLGYDALCIEEQHIFLDLALFSLLSEESQFYGQLDKWEWMGVMHGKAKDEIHDSVNILQRKGLLDSVYEGDELKVNIHDLYKEFAEAESQGGPFERRHFLVSIEAADRVPKELLKHPPNGLCWPCLRRLVIWGSKVRSLTGANLGFCKNVELLDLRWCDKLEVVDVTGMINLRCVMVYQCFEFAELIGLEKLLDLVMFHFCSSRRRLTPSFLRNMSSLRALQVLGLRFLSWSDVDTFPADLSAGYVWISQELNVSDARGMFGTGAGVQNIRNSLPKSLLKVDFSGSSQSIMSSLMSLMRSLTKLQELCLRYCDGINDLRVLCELTLLQKLDVGDTEICELPSDMRALKHLQVLNVMNCRNLTSLVGLSQCATALRRVDASGCWRLRDLPDDFRCFQKLEILDLWECRSICTLPKGYERLAGPSGKGTWILRPTGCYGLIEPLVKMLRLPEKCHVKCVDTCNFGGDSMQSWVDGWKDVNRVAYESLRRVFSFHILRLDRFWTYMLDSGEVGDFMIRALCEHDDRDVNGSHRLVNIVRFASRGFSDEDLEYTFPCWWMVVMTAPCTFGVVMERAKVLEPWRSTLLHHTISTILPKYVICHRVIPIKVELNRMEVASSLCMAIQTVLQKCKENLEKAIVEGILPMHSREGLKIVDVILGAIAAANGLVIGMDSILWFDSDRREYGGCYGELFPKIPFEEFLRLQQMDLEWWTDDLEEEICEVELI